MSHHAQAALLMLLAFFCLSGSASAQDFSFKLEQVTEGPLEHSWILSGQIPHFDDVVLDCSSFIHEFRFRSKRDPASNFGWYLDAQECHDIENQILTLLFAGAQACVQLTPSPYEVVIDKCLSSH